MNIKYFFLIASIVLCTMGCKHNSKIKAYGWTCENEHTTIDSLQNYFSMLKDHGFTGVCHTLNSDDISKHERAARIAHANGLEYHAWQIGLLNQKDSAFGVVNRNGDHCFKVQAYVSGYKFMCPSREDVFDYLAKQCTALCAIPDVDYIHFDFIRFPDVILARGLWDKYGLVMNEEYDVADYCYCDICVNNFKQKTGIDICKTNRPDTCNLWIQYRYDLITNLVNRLCDVIHKGGKKASAAVFPGPSIAKKLVRQEWNKWNMDAFFPMNYNDFYNENVNWLGTIVNEEVKAIKKGQPLYSGLFICKDWQARDTFSDPEFKGLRPDEIGQAIELSISNGAKGVCLFMPDRMTNAHWQTFDRLMKNK
ncbi:MAG: hypothetical protein LBR28_05230 [Bacteroidales bacterium]|jgi:hypothetical protein|nr:hypothetical protein [Bacteroidales bacterium]